MALKISSICHTFSRQIAKRRQTARQSLAPVTLQSKKPKCRAAAADRFLLDACDTTMKLLRIYLIISWFHTWWHWGAEAVIHAVAMVSKQQNRARCSIQWHLCFVTSMHWDLSGSVSRHSRLPYPSAFTLFVLLLFNSPLQLFHVWFTKPFERASALITLWG